MKDALNVDLRTIYANITTNVTSTFNQICVDWSTSNKIKHASNDEHSKMLAKWIDLVEIFDSHLKEKESEARVTRQSTEQRHLTKKELHIKRFMDLKQCWLKMRTKEDDAPVMIGHTFDLSQIPP